MTASSNWNSRAHPEVLVLFDVDGTLTPSRKTVTPDILEMLAKLRERVVIGFVGGSDFPKQQEQLGEDVVDRFDYCFSENGLTAFRSGTKLSSQSFIGFLGEERYTRLVNFALRYIANLEIPVKRGTFIEFRNGMVNICPIGRNCSYAERDAFEVYDKEHNIRKKFVAELQHEFADYGLTFAIGGQISFDVFPTGWDKTYCLRHVREQNFKEIHFFGDRTLKGGNDYEIYTHPDVIGHSVESPADTLRMVRELFLQ
ncbi:eukaryotic phosphomannomutase [Thamnocephalis sphaerospora]|uniref:Phosphomannomutase n=1 Tax=Thamnocephalis sphaerospora TaxID=78915 RepID=A0A4P9XIE2_9FUNG|nr:eukaryotic phosphomannomutase [Thamnocephalis sphaerospora]|eukprot:RKP05121.1 eukaryotic phosphomannomutase [Thamnocephalis sphaerospora]